MALSNYTIGGMIQADPQLHRRVAACAQEQSAAVSATIDPEAWAEEHSWAYAMAPGWVAKVASAIENGVMDWGNDPTVITDGDIMSWVQPIIVAGASG